jgi:hypothetical protein
MAGRGPPIRNAATPIRNTPAPTTTALIFTAAGHGRGVAGAASDERQKHRVAGRAAERLTGPFFT